MSDLYNTYINSSGNILDLIFSNSSDVSYEIADEAIFDCDSYHLPFKINICPKIDPLKICNYIYDFKNADYAAILILIL
ncbi:unnamed protein product [Acanthoscelides obtectus]|uniref:Uncharacterized protein n=1 Tax=Acanthoscelides obtectus TaxID=200917 RepID=A0A9P0NSS4_ACAOB|nr:unnamed protein product [Acanthoscelides obtectus]CAK1678511.1 hypothetical protein AOBTE_LOCUS31944 [Acanthoscelides obtectus]